MLRHMFRLSAVSTVLLLALISIEAQTLSDCRASPPMRPNAKPGVGDLNMSRDGKTLVVASGDGKVRFIDLKSGEVQRTLSGHTNMVYTTRFTHDEKLMATSSRDQTARIWDVASGRELHQLSGFRCSVKAVAFSPDAQIVAASGNDGMIKVRDVRTGTELKSLVHRNSADIDMSVYAFVFSRDGKKIYAANGDGTISEWDVGSGKEIRSWKAHENFVYRLTFSPDYKLLASFGDSDVKLWDTATWREVRTLSMPHVDGIRNQASSLAFSNNGQFIAASNIGIDSKQNTYAYIRAMVWKVKTGETLFTVDGQHRFDINGLVFTHDDRFLLTGSVDTTISFWDMKTGQKTRTIMLDATTKTNH
jgi:WD40 repeat protein